ncbi:MAG: hypothetical protein WCK02_06435 [Bacteroidota bacterium]
MQKLSINITDYYAFGMEMGGRSFNSNSSTRGMNGQEKDNDITQGLYTAKFWEYDSRIARRWNLDPKPQIHISDYACFGNNPIFNIDLLGDEFVDRQGKKDSKVSGKIIEKANKQKTEINNKINENNGKLNGMNSADKEFAKLSEENINLNNKISELNTMIDEVVEMNNSDMKFFLNPTSNYNDENNRVKGNVRYKNGIIQMNYNVGNTGTMAHELKHGYQALKGEFSFNKETGAPGWLYDLTDEQAAKQRGSAFGYLSDPLLKVSTSDLIVIYGYDKDIPSVNLNSSMLIEYVLSAWANGRPFEMQTKYDGKTFKDFEEDFVK